MNLLKPKLMLPKLKKRQKLKLNKKQRRKLRPMQRLRL
jgi:hypothetical protein